MKKYIFFLLLLFCISCHEPKEIFEPHVKNNTNYSIAILIGHESRYKYVKDTILYGDFEQYVIELIKPNENSSLYYTLINKELSQTDTLSLFITNEDLFYSNSWNDICEKYLILCRYDLSGRDIQHLNYIISYPPSPEMRTMHIYPSYDEILERCENKEN
ncbi:MAG: hypothetical protein MJ211_13125 [Bacteroidales bacterium]|nr:hypothetical protein [Bacteroidales bacterium]